MDGITEKIKELKAEMNAVILAHYYTSPEVQKIADYVGDSFYLAKMAKASDADTVVFAGVSFMGESAKLLCPDKRVLMPDLKADCAMAHMVDLDKIQALRARYQDLAVVCYINSTAEVKRHSDVCVTSSNAVKIVKSLPNNNILFIPDGNLGAFVKEKVPEKNVILNDGYCPIHAAVSAEEILKSKALHPQAKVLTHPECKKEVLELSDFIGSTADIIKFANESECTEFIIVTEDGVLYPLVTKNPSKKFYPVREGFVCSDMKLNTVEKILEVLQNGKNEVFVDSELAKSAMLPLERMLEIAK